MVNVKRNLNITLVVQVIVAALRKGRGERKSERDDNIVKKLSYPIRSLIISLLDAKGNDGWGKG